MCELSKDKKALALEIDDEFEVELNTKVNGDDCKCDFGIF